MCQSAHFLNRSPVAKHIADFSHGNEPDAFMKSLLKVLYRQSSLFVQRNVFDLKPALICQSEPWQYV